MDTNLHSLLKKQIKTYLIDDRENKLPKDIDKFLSTINSTFLNFDKDTQKVEGLELQIDQRTRELEKLNKDLKTEIEEIKTAPEKKAKKIV